MYIGVSFNHESTNNSVETKGLISKLGYQISIVKIQMILGWEQKKTRTSQPSLLPFINHRDPLASSGSSNYVRLQFKPVMLGLMLTAVYVNGHNLLRGEKSYFLLPLVFLQLKFIIAFLLSIL